jgi:predicted nucleotidyltransferase
MPIGLSPEHKKLILDCVRRYFPNCDVLFFGSRFSGGFKPSSDLDICLRGSSPLNPSAWAQLEADVSDSDLPYKVDLIDWHRLSSDFQQSIQKNSTTL